MNGPGLLRAAACAAVIVLGAAGVRAASVARRAEAAGAAAPAAAAVSNGAARAVADEPEAPSADVAQEIRIAVANAALATGDAPGTDSRIAPRPKRSTRLLDGPLDARGSRVRIYSTPADAGEVLAELARGIEASGFVKSAADDEPGTLSYRRGDDFVVARATTIEPKDGHESRRTVLSIVEFGFTRARAASRPEGEE